MKTAELRSAPADDLSAFVTYSSAIDFRLWLVLECEPMSKDWIGRMFGERETEKSLAAQRIEDEKHKQKRIAELAPTIWLQIEKVLKEAIASFNERSSIPINLDPYSKDYTLEVNAANYQYGWIVKFEVETGTLSFGNPLTEFIHANLHIKLEDDSHYSFYDRRNSKENISIENIDEVLLKGFVRLILKDPGYSVKPEP
ncbi:hypothetical protein SBA2_30051 [Acidobacteriia bacterium SbA2]|nr:hypothetical protein SBA2_30051 [Acidobacteriia bacterium SbA2]